jgi:hypothetical protein
MGRDAWLAPVSAHILALSFAGYKFLSNSTSPSWFGALSPNVGKRIKRCTPHYFRALSTSFF